MMFNGFVKNADEFPRHILELLRRVLADRDLDPVAALLACALCCRTLGPDSCFSRGELARLGRGSAAGIAAAIDQLLICGHLEAAGSRYRLRMIKASGPPADSITPFPLRRRLAFVRKQAARIAELSSKLDADAHLRQQLAIQADTLRRKGVAEGAISQEIRGLESAIRSEAWRMTSRVEAP
jgi:hypothetical protein